MTRKRAKIARIEQLAATLALLLREELRDALREAKAPAEDVIAHFQFDHHPIPHAWGGEDKWWNLAPLPVAMHREKSRDDTRRIAKTKRISRTQEEFRARMLKPDKGRSEETPRSRWGGGRKLQSRNNFRRPQP